MGGTAPSILRRAHAHRGPTASSKNATTPLACASVQSPQAQAGPRRGPERRSSIRCRSLRCEHPLPRKRVQPSTNRSLKMRTVPCSVSLSHWPSAVHTAQSNASERRQKRKRETRTRGVSVESVRPSRWTDKKYTKCAPDKHLRMGFNFDFISILFRFYFDLITISCVFLLLCPNGGPKTDLPGSCSTGPCIVPLRT